MKTGEPEQNGEQVSILLVDDTPANLLAMEATLERLGEDMVRAYSGQEALRLMERQEFAVVLLDVQMPIMDGIETAARIREREAVQPGGRRTPIIFVTAAELTETHVRRAYAEGAVDFVRKPYVPEIMRSKTQVFVDLFRNTRSLRRSIEDRERAEEEVRQLNHQLERRVAERTADLKRALEQAEASEQRYRTLAETMPQIIWTAKPDGWVDYFNSRWAEEVQMPAEQAFGWGWATAVHPEDLISYEEQWNHARERGELMITEVRLRCKPDDRYCWYLSRATPLKNSDGQIIRWLGTLTDIEIQKRAESVLQEANTTLGEARDRAVEASKAKSLFLANMSHELRTPLNAIIGYAEILEEELTDSQDSKNTEDVRRIILAGQHLLALINDVLDLAKIEAGKITLTYNSFALESLIQQVASSVTPMAEQRKNELIIDCGNDCGTLYADEVKVRQILINLMSNACKFTESGTIRIQVSRQQENGANWVVIAVQDTGIGIATNQMPKLFKEFSQADPSPTRNYGGTGLGLAISRRYAEMMGGDISVQSVEGEGSTFTVRLPLKDEEIPALT